MHPVPRISMSEFAAAVFEIVRRIPAGRVTSYGAIARAAGLPRHSRMVGRILRGGSDDGLPAHRVVDSTGHLSGSGHFDTPTTMVERLEAEGIAVTEGRIKDFAALFWNPEEIGIFYD